MTTREVIDQLCQERRALRKRLNQLELAHSSAGRAERERVQDEINRVNSRIDFYRSKEDD